MNIEYENEHTFKLNYYGSTQIFNTKFKKVANKGDDIELDQIIIFDGGDKDGYEKDN